LDKKKPRAQNGLMVILLIAIFVYGYLKHRKDTLKQRDFIVRQKVGQKKFTLYINNYDEEELEGKVRKVMDADRQ
jgi:hypothetical protein